MKQKISLTIATVFMLLFACVISTYARPTFKIKFNDLPLVPPIIQPLSLGEEAVVSGILYPDDSFEITFKEAVGNVIISISKDDTVIEECAVNIAVDSQVEVFSLSEYGNGNYTVCITLPDDNCLYAAFIIEEE